MTDTRLEIAEQVLRAAGKLIRERLNLDTELGEKEPGHIVTALDVAVDRLATQWIQREFIHDRLYSEESGFSGGKGEHLWVLDPVDGTSNVRVGLPYVSTSLAVQRDAETILSAVYNPLLDEMILAEKGSGAYLNKQRLCVSSGRSLSIGYYVQGYRVPPPVQLEVLRVLLPASYRVLQTWAPTLDWCNIARGRAEFLVGYDTEVEDYIQGRLILEEAGGRVTAWDGRTMASNLLPCQRTSIIATNGAAHEELCRVLEGAAVAASLRGYVSPLEHHSLQATIGVLTRKLRSLKDVPAKRISVELGLSQAAWEHNNDLRYLVSQAEALQQDPQHFLQEIFNGVAPHLSGEQGRKSVLNALAGVAETIEVDRHSLEIAAQALEIAAADSGLHDQMLVTGCPREVVETLKRTLIEDSFDVAGRLKRNVYRELAALAGAFIPEATEPICRLSDLSVPAAAQTCPPPNSSDGFAALIITAGRGTRLRTSVPKGLIPLDGRPLLSHTVDALRAAGAARIAVVVGYKADLHLPVLDADLVVIEQARQMGTGHAVMMARPYFEGYAGPLLVTYSDMPFVQPSTFRELLTRHRTTSAALTILTTSREHRPEFGRVLRRDGKVYGIGQVRFSAEESGEVDAGFYCFRAPDFWRYLGQVQNANNRREFVLTEITTHLAENAQEVATCFIGDKVQTLGINRPSELIEAQSIIYRQGKRNASATDVSGPESDLYWQMRFYEAYGGIRAEPLWRPPLNNGLVERCRAIVTAYDRAVSEMAGTIFHCLPVV